MQSMSKKKEKIVGVKCDDSFLVNTQIDLHGSMSSFLGIVQALQYTIMHEEDFRKVFSDCDGCFRSIVKLQSYLSTLISQAVEHEEQHKN